MFEKFKNILNEVNLYGLDFNLLYRKEKTYSTLFDVFLSLIYLSLLIIVSVIYFSDIFNNKGFSLVTNTIELNHKYEINLFNSNILFIISHYSGRFVNFDPSYLSFKILKAEFNMLNNTDREIEEYNNITELKYEECSNSIKDNIILNFFHFEKAYCLSKNQNLIISGSFGNRIIGYKSIIFRFGKCINSTDSNITCKSNEQIEQYLSNIQINLFYDAYSLDHYNVKNPVKKIIQNDFFLPSLKVYKRYIYNFQPSEYISDCGLILNSENKIYFFQHDDNLIEFNDNPIYSIENDGFLEIALSVKNSIKEYNRKYVKFQDAFGNIGGCTDLIFNILKLISYYFAEKSFLIEFSSSLINGPKLCPQNDNILRENKKKLKELIEKENNNTLIKKNNLVLNSPNKKDGTTIQFISQKDKISTNNFLKTLNVKNDLQLMNLFPQSEFRQYCTCYKEKLKYNFFDYCIPFFIMEKFNHKDIVNTYENIFKKYLSVEVMIPIFERLNRSLELGGNDGYYFKLDSFLKKNNQKFSF